MNSLYLILASVIFILAMWFVVAFRYARGMRKEIEKIWFEIDGYLRKRHDLLPGLVEVLRKYGIEERQVSDAIEARSKARKIYFPNEPKAKAESLYGINLKELMDKEGEAKVDMTFLAYKKEILELELIISSDLQKFNTKVDHFNTKRLVWWMRPVCFMARYRAVERFKTQQ